MQSDSCWRPAILWTNTELIRQGHRPEAPRPTDVALWNLKFESLVESCKVAGSSVSFNSTHKYYLDTDYVNLNSKVVSVPSFPRGVGTVQVRMTRRLGQGLHWALGVRCIIRADSALLLDARTARSNSQNTDLSKDLSCITTA